MKTGTILAYVLCGVIIICAWVVCFLPTIFYMNPLEIPPNENHVNVSLNTSLMPLFPCNPPLIFSNQSGFCKPACDWLPFSKQEQHGMLIADWITTIFCITCFCIILATWLKLPEFMKFPHFIILLMAGITAFIEILVIIPKLGKESEFFCSSVFADEAINKPTAFCETQGVLIHYTSLVIGELFVIYNAVLLKHLVLDKLPCESYSKKFLSILFLAVLILPIFPVIYVLKAGDSYTVLYLRYCFPRNADEGYFSCLLPQQLFVGIGTTCILLVIFKLIKERKSSLIGSPSQARRRQIQLQKIAIQFIIVIISYIVCVYLSYGVLCIQLNNRRTLGKSLEEYFGCLIFTKNCPEDFREYVTPYGLMIVFLLAGIVFQGGTFILLVGKQKARNLWRSWWFDLTTKCRHPKPAKGRMPRSTSSAQELQPSTSEKKTDTKN
ncbi:uncharacterized protein LOC111334640 isoform X1 [Paramuricea clavata]|uniref:Uncharacterized protein LOC111334640 isoform X1 n=1 Tax=Paramuricea clavata TaxID=317549 RepID=A0A7D9HJ39_PARCT|nr:uncharacterized protein LOC111334640 isoform X1 [Paramuricea clavata]